MNNTGHLPATLISREYQRIEQKVVELYRKLNIRSFPIKPHEIAEKLGYSLIPYSRLTKKKRDTLRTIGAGISVRDKNGKYRIFYEDIDTYERQRFTIMHEIGHIQLGHREDSELAEKCANYYAPYALAPSPIIGLYKCEDFMEVAIRFGMSQEGGMYAFERFSRWRNIPVALKPHELELNRLFTKKK